MGSTPQLIIRWSNHASVLQKVFGKLLEDEQFVDVTLACEGQSIKCHRMVLAACSTYFHRILVENQSSNLVILLADMKFWVVRAIVAFMYKGEVSIKEEKLQQFFKAAEALKIKGLYGDAGLANGNWKTDEECNVMDKRDVGVQQKAILRNNLGAILQDQKSRQMKRKVLAEPRKFGKAQRMDRQSSWNAMKQPHSGNAVGIVKKPEMEQNRAIFEGFGVTNGRGYRKFSGEEEEQTEEIAWAEEDNSDSVGSDGCETQEGQMFENKSAAQSGMTRQQQYSGINGVLKNSEMKNEEENGLSQQSRSLSPKANGLLAINSLSDIVFLPKTTVGPPLDTADRKERLEKAMHLALSGIPVRRAAAHFDLPRTTLCAFMKRRGLSSPFPRGVRNAPATNSPIEMEASAGSNGQEAASFHDDFPFLNNSQQVDGMGQDTYENHEDVDGEEEFSES